MPRGCKDVKQGVAPLPVRVGTTTRYKLPHLRLAIGVMLHNGAAVQAGHVAS